MSPHTLTPMLNAIDKLERAVDGTLRRLDAGENKLLSARVSSYKEIVRRQRDLIDELSRATAQSDWHEVSRLTSLVHGASLLIKVDAGFILSTLRARSAAAA